MALSIQDLDQLLQYDPASHSVSGFPKPRTDTLGGAGLGEAANAADRIPSVGAAPAQQTASNPAIPKLESVPPPNITPAPAYTPGSTISSATGETANVKPKLSGWDKLKGGLAKAANIAGDVLAPEVMPLIPGTDLNKVWQQNREAKLAGENARTGFTNAETQNLQEGGKMVPWTNPETGETTEVPERSLAALEGAGVKAGAQENVAGTKAQAGAAAADKKKQDAIAEGYAKMGYNATFAPDGSIADVQPIQGFKPPASKQDTYHEWLESHPNGTYDDFQKDVQQIKKAAGPSGMSIYGLSRMMNMAYEMDPRLIPILPSLMREAGINTSGLNLEGPAPGQPRNEAGNPIGIRMPESPTGATRGRGQFAQAITDQIPSIQQDVTDLKDQLGPISGRWNEFLVGKVGADNPAYFGLKTDLTNLATAWMRLHANSEGARADFERILSTAKSPDDLVSALNKIDKLAQDYVRIGGGNQPKETPQRPKGVPDNAIWDGEKRQWRLP